MSIAYTMVRRLEADTKKQNMPVIGDYFVREIPPSDNVRFSPPLLLGICGYSCWTNWWDSLSERAVLGVDIKRVGIGRLYIIGQGKIDEDAFLY